MIPLFPVNVKKVFKLVLLVIPAFFLSFMPGGFRENQLKYTRVKTAYFKKWSNLQMELKSKNISTTNFEVHLRNFKREKELEVWVRSKDSQKFVLLKTYTTCAVSGVLGPKRKEGDLQVPEGFYEISWFNPMSDYHLGLKVNYPNQSDRIKSKGSRPGGDIMIHGNCVTIGCIPIENEPIEELYVLCVESKTNNHDITLSMYPCKLNETNWLALQKNNSLENINFWKPLKEAFLFFETHHIMPQINVSKEGNYEININ
jgi:murein L,D-transpeptidase YafK